MYFHSPSSDTAVQNCSAYSCYIIAYAIMKSSHCRPPENDVDWFPNCGAKRPSEQRTTDPEALAEEGAKENGERRTARGDFYPRSGKWSLGSPRLWDGPVAGIRLPLRRRSGQPGLCQDRRAAAMERCIRNIDLRQNENDCNEQKLKNQHCPRPTRHGLPQA
jgi:hypothetical protein